MSKYIKKGINFVPAVLGVLAFIILYISTPPSDYRLGAATLSKGTTFTTNQTVQYYDLNNLVDLAGISGIVSSEITDGTIVQGDMANNSIGTANIIDATIVTGDVANRTLLGINIATNTVDGINLATNQVINSGTWWYTNVNTFISYTNTTLLFSTNQISSGSVNGTSVTAGAADANKVVRLNASGVLDSTLTPFSSSYTSTNCAVVFSSTLTQAHGLGAAPSLVQVHLVCTSGELGYSIGDVVCNFGPGDANNIGATVAFNATSVIVKTTSNGIYLTDSGSAYANGVITAGNWRYVLRAYK